MFGYDDVHAALHAHRRSWRPAQGGGSSNGPAPRPYIVSVDVARAFESVDTRVVMALVEGLLRSPSYMIIKFSEVRRCSGTA